MPMLTDIGSLLQTAGIGTVGTDILLGFGSHTPVNCVVLDSYGGTAPDLVAPLEQPRVEVTVRNTVKDTGYIKAMAVITALHGLSEQTVNGHRYLLIRALNSPESLGDDLSDSRCFEWTVNFEIIRERE